MDKLTEYDNRRIGGTDKNPIVSSFFVLDTAIEKATIKLGRGRVTITTFEKDDNDINVFYRFENHNKKRGWTLETSVVLFDVDGNKITADVKDKGLKPKGWSGYRRATLNGVFAGVADKAHFALVVSRRDPTNRVGKPIEEIYEKVLKKVSEEIENWIKEKLFGEDDDSDDDDTAVEDIGTVSLRPTA